MREKAKSISEEKIKQFYQTNTEEFEVVERVNVRHIRVDNQELADQVVAEIKAGLDFSAAIKKYSIADDKNAPIPGDLGWLKRSDKNRSWLHAVAFMQQTGKVSAPFRSPQIKAILFTKFFLPTNVSTVTYPIPTQPFIMKRAAILH